MTPIRKALIGRVVRFARANAEPPALGLQARYPQHDIGRHTYGPLTIRDDGSPSRVTIGKFTSIASGVVIFTGGEHRTDWVTTFPFSELWDSGRDIVGHPMSRGDVRIGNDVWLGADAMVMSGVTIGDGAVVGARAVVTHDVPPYAVVAGSPARVVRRRFDDDVVEALCAIKWWEWPDADVEAAIPLLLNADPRAFIERVRRGALGPAAQAPEQRARSVQEERPSDPS